ncbi:hypothetical protein SAMN04487901_10629 [Prevotella communis]|uniref:Cleaved Adhesin Domain n=1 Tax=Prevotella communis TaxID=2913614 RepID=A0A1G7VM09_9BACT|nr:hypothetical protein [Prevotella communis]SDG60598.1 hypothetical protein SAMN04487901_10629 [Prevotella communis]
MKKLYATILMAMMAMVSMAQETNDTTYVMMDFNANPWSYSATELTSKWYPDYTDLDSPGAILNEKDFSWPVSEGSSSNVKVTVYPVDLDEYSKVSVYASYTLDEADVAALGINAGKTNMLYTQPGTTMRFEAPAGYKFGKMVFYNYRNANFLVGDDYEEEFEYEYNNTVFKQKLKVWTPASPKKNAYEYDIWQGDDTNVLFNYSYFSAIFVKIDIRLVPNGSAGIGKIVNGKSSNGACYDLQGRRVNVKEKGIYIVDGRKIVK